MRKWGNYADEIHEQILHRVVQTDVEIAVKAQILPVDGDAEKKKESDHEQPSETDMEDRDS